MKCILITRTFCVSRSSGVSLIGFCQATNNKHTKNHRESSSRDQWPQYYLHHLAKGLMALHSDSADVCRLWQNPETVCLLRIAQLKWTHNSRSRHWGWDWDRDRDNPGTLIVIDLNRSQRIIITIIGNLQTIDILKMDRLLYVSTYLYQCIAHLLLRSMGSITTNRYGRDPRLHHMYWDVLNVS